MKTKRRQGGGRERGGERTGWIEDRGGKEGGKGGGECHRGRRIKIKKSLKRMKEVRKEEM